MPINIKGGNCFISSASSEGELIVFILSWIISAAVIALALKTLNVKIKRYLLPLNIYAFLFLPL